MRPDEEDRDRRPGSSVPSRANDGARRHRLSMNRRAMRGRRVARWPPVRGPNSRAREPAEERVLEGRDNNSGWVLVASAIIALVVFTGLLYIRGGRAPTLTLGGGGGPRPGAAR